jgi:hypothetical protein
MYPVVSRFKKELKKKKVPLEDYTLSGMPSTALQDHLTIRAHWLRA